MQIEVHLRDMLECDGLGSLGDPGLLLIATLRERVNSVEQLASQFPRLVPCFGEPDGVEWTEPQLVAFAIDLVLE
jgi:hypothetical protein